MIAFLRGKVASVGPDTAVIDVGGEGGGIGFTVQAAPGTLADLKVGDPATVPTSLVVREESLTLYGFGDADERTVFELLQTASGVGPRLALAMLAVHRPNDLRRAVAADDLTALTKVPGIGKKGAQRIVLELKDRLGPVTSAGSGADDFSGAASGADGFGGAGGPAGLGPDWREQVHAGLVGLGWTAREAEAAVDAVAPMANQQTEENGRVDVGTLLRSALRTLSRT